ncbi:hypothetical protein [Nostoc sp.]
MALLHPDRSDRYEGKRTYTSDACGGLRLRASSGFVDTLSPEGTEILRTK